MPRERSRRTTKRPRTKAAHGLSRTGIGAAALAVIVALFVAWQLSQRGPSRGTESVASGSAALAALDLPGANRLAVQHAQAREFLESLPYFRRELELLDHEVWGLRFDFATVLNDAAFQVRTHRGLTLQSTRSTLERAALVRESLLQLDRAELAASRPDEIARIRERRAHILWTWGLRWDGMQEYHDALAALPPSRSIADRIKLRTAQMTDPLQASEDEPPVP